MWFFLKTDHKLAANQQLPAFCTVVRFCPSAFPCSAALRTLQETHLSSQHKTAPFLCILLLSGKLPLRTLSGCFSSSQSPPPYELLIVKYQNYDCYPQFKNKENTSFILQSSALQAVSHSSSGFLYTDVVGLVSSCSQNLRVGCTHLSHSRELGWLFRMASYPLHQPPPVASLSKRVAWMC